MVQKNLPYLNKSGYSMFWNSMWDNKNNFYKNLQIDFFLKNFILFFFSDFFQNQFFKAFNKKNFNKIDFFFKKYNFNLNLNKKNYIIYLLNSSEINLYSSKIWLFKLNNWVVVYFFVYSRLNSIFKKNEKYNYENNQYIYNILFKYNFKLNKKNTYNFIFKKYNF